MKSSVVIARAKDADLVFVKSPLSLNPYRVIWTLSESQVYRGQIDGNPVQDDWVNYDKFE